MPSVLRRARVPLAAVAIPAAFKLGLVAMAAGEVGVEYLFVLGQVFMASVAVALVVLIGWFYLGSGLSRRVKLGVGAAALALAAAAFAAVRTVEFDGAMTPHPVFRWEKSAGDALAEYVAQTPPAGGAADLTVGPADSPAFRGPLGTGHTPGAAIPEALNVAWKRPAGGGHGGVAVAGTAVVTIEQRGDTEAVVCLDRATGLERWVHAYPAKFTTSEPLGGGGPRTTPAIAGGDVFALGALGDLVCLDGRTGARKWHANALADAGSRPPVWAVSGSPLVVGDNVVVNPGASSAEGAVAAYDRATGKRVWAAGRHPAAYASPALMTLAGVAQVVVFDADGLGAHDPATGAELWRHPWKSDMGMNSAQPVAVGPDRLFVSSEKSNGGAVLEVTRTGSVWAVNVVWQSRALSARYTSPVLVGAYLYGLGDGRMVCVDAATGKRAWADGRYGNGQILAAGDRLVVTAESGDVAVVAADPVEHRELSRVEVFGTRTWNTPALAGAGPGTAVFARNHREIACLVGGR